MQDDSDIRHFEDFHLGDTYDLGTYELSKAEIIEFAGAYDPQPFHLDEEAAKGTLLGALCASGWHGCGIVMRMLVDGLLENSASMGSSGVESVKWVRPILPGTLTATASILETRPSASRPEMGIVRMRTVLRDAAGEILMSMDAPSMQRRRWNHETA